MAVVKGALSNWIPKLTRLKYLNLWEGEALRDTGVPIRTHCPSFAELKFWRWYFPYTSIADRILT